MQAYSGIYLRNLVKCVENAIISNIVTIHLLFLKHIWLNLLIIINNNNN